MRDFPAESPPARGAVSPPFRLAYWVDPPWLMAGCYPGHGDRRIAERQLGALLDCGIRCFLNLMEEDARGPFIPYEPALEKLAEKRSVAIEFLRFEIEDHSIPSWEQMREIERAIATSIAAVRPVYIHCWGGRGRTGIVAGVYLVRHGLATPEGFAEVIGELRAGATGESPETEEQIGFVRSYLAGTRPTGSSPGSAGGALTPATG
jgi:hypothetical protein